MTIISDLIPVSSLKVGDPGTAYACTRFEREVEVTGPEHSSAAAYRRERWTAVCHAQAASVDAVAALWETIRGHFVRRGERVTLTTWTGSRTLPETGTPSGVEERSVEGYPTVSIAEIADRSFGTWLTFTVRAETLVPLVGVGDVVEHDYTVQESEGETGLITVSQRGRVRMKNGTSARAWVDENVIDDARAAAEAEDHAFSVRYTQGLDPAVIDYEYTDADRTTAGGGGLSDARVEDRTSQSVEGRIVRTVSGYAQGPGAATYAASQEPEPSPTLLQIRRDVSQPSVPEGRVNFTYEFLTGVEHVSFPGIIIFNYQETIEQVSGGRSAQVQEFYDAVPEIRLGTQAAYVYGQQTAIEFTGDWADHGITCAFDTAYLAREPSIRKSGGQQGLRRVAMTFVIVSPEAVDPLPDPRQIEAFA